MQSRRPIKNTRFRFAIVFKNQTAFRPIFSRVVTCARPRPPGTTITRCDAEITAGVAREEKRLARLQKELNAADAAVRRAVAGRLNASWLSPAALLKGRPLSRGGGELRREVKAVREEWKERETKTAADAAAAAAAAALDEKIMAAPNLVEGKPKGGSGGRSDGLGKTWPRLGFPLLSRKGTLRDVSTAGNGAGFSATHPAPTAANKTVASATKPATSHTAEEVEREARGRILRRNRELARDLVAHDFDVRSPPPLTCCAPGCRRTFTQDEHYLAHWDPARGSAGKENPPPQQHEKGGAASRPPSPSAARPGKGSPPPRPRGRESCGVGATAAASRPSTPSAGKRGSTTAVARPPTPAAAEAGAEAGHPELGGEGVASFHLVVASKAEEGGGRERLGLDDDGGVGGFDLVLAYITRVWGHGQAYNTLLFVDAVESWRRRYLTTDPGFAEGAADLRREYLSYGAPREARLPEGTRRDLMRVLGTLPDDPLDGSAGGAQDDDGSGGGAGGGGDGENGDDSRRDRSVSVDNGVGRRETTHSEANGKSGRRKAPVLATAVAAPTQQRNVVGKSAGFSATAAAAAAASAAADPEGLRPTSFDEAQFQALAFLSRVVGPGFWASDLGRRATALHLKDLKHKREAAHEIVRLEVCDW